MDWDVESFSNESAQNWLKELVSTVSGDGVKHALGEVDRAAAFVDSQDAERAIAACEIVAASRGFSSLNLPAEAAMWIKAQQYCASDGLVEKAIAVVDKVLKKSELREVWDDTEAGPQWRQVLLDLTDRLDKSTKSVAVESADLLGGGSSMSATASGAGKTVESLFNEAVDLVSEGNHEAAIEKYGELIEMDPSYIVGYIGRGTSCLAMGLFQEALNDFNSAMQISSEVPEIYYLRAQAYFQLGEMARTIADLTILANLQPDRADAFLMRGLANAELARWDKAADDFTKALEFDPDSGNAYLHRARAYEKQGRFDLAGKDQKQYERMMGMEPRI